MKQTMLRWLFGVCLVMCTMPAWAGTFQPGDELWTRRTIGSLSYHHSGVYVGNGQVVHVNSTPRQAALRLLKGRSIVRVERSGLHRFSKGRAIKLGPTRPRFPRNVIVKRALSKAGQSYGYDPLRKNCQHFSSKIVSGQARSPEAQTMARIAKAVAQEALKKTKKAAQKAAKKTKKAAQKAAKKVKKAAKKTKKVVKKIGKFFKKKKKKKKK